MSSFEQKRTSFHGPPFNEHRSRPRVNLPAMPGQRPAAPPNGYYAASAAPNAMSLNDDFPSLPATPQVNLPIGQSHPDYLSSIPPSVATQSDLEGHLRGMILSNGVPDRPIPLQTPSNGSTTFDQRASRRPNQGQRRQQTAQPNVPYNSPSSGHPLNPWSRASDLTRNMPSRQGPDGQYQLPHLRGLGPQPGQSGNYYPKQGGFDLAAQRQTSGYPMGLNPSSQIITVQNQAHHRPPPTNRQLYNPGPYSMQSQQTERSRGQISRASLDTQIAYLESLAHVEISKAQISREEFLEKQALRQSLEQLCRMVVSEHEMQEVKNAAFVPDSIELKCFGSLSTTFATKSSDMDLVLVSPMSKPETSSPDSEIPRLIEKALLNSGYGARLLTRTRVPIIRFCEKPTPELADLLLAERIKYEKEKEASREAKNQETLKRKEKRPEKSDTPLPQDQSNDIATNEARDEVERLSVPKSEEHQGHNQSESSKTSGHFPSDIAQTKVGGPSHTDGDTQIKKLVDKRERDDPSLAEKSDVERARLYKLAVRDGWYEPPERRRINHFLSALERHGVSKPESDLRNKLHDQPSDRRDPQSVDDEQLDKARAALLDLPNILGRYRPPPAAHPLDFPKDGVGIQCDINFSNHLALHNSHLLKCYASCDPRVRQMVLFVKAWSKKRKINSPYHGTLSSYGYVLMVLHYLINIAKPPVLPNLQVSAMRLQDKMSAKEVSLEGYNVQFFRNEEKILDLAHRGQITYNQEPVGSLLHGFFHYFALQGQASPSGGFAWIQDTLSLRTIGGIIDKQVKGWTGAKTETVDMSGPGPQTKEIRQRYLFAIEDPFEINHNIARTVVHQGIVAIRDEFRRAHTLIKNAGIIPGKGPEDLFAEGDEKENLQYRPFGPRPRKDMAGGPSGPPKSTGRVAGQKDEVFMKDEKGKDGGNAGSDSNHLTTAK